MDAVKSTRTTTLNPSDGRSLGNIPRIRPANLTSTLQKLTMLFITAVRSQGIENVIPRRPNPAVATSIRNSGEIRVDPAKRIKPMPREIRGPSGPRPADSASRRLTSASFKRSMCHGLMFVIGSLATPAQRKPHHPVAHNYQAIPASHFWDCQRENVQPMPRRAKRELHEGSRLPHLAALMACRLFRPRLRLLH